MSVRQHSLSVGADLVRHLARAPKHPVTADEHELDLPPLHQVSGRIVGDHVVRHPLLRQFPCGETGALATRPRFIAENMEALALRLGGVYRGGCTADIHKSQPPGVAVREHVHTAADQLGAMAPDLLAMADVLGGELLRGRKRERLAFGDGSPGAHRRKHLVHGVDRIDRGRTGGFEGFEHARGVCLQFAEVRSPKGVHALRESVGGGRANRAGAADDHVFDGGGCFPEVSSGYDLEPVRQEPLLDEKHSVLLAVEGDSPVSPASPAHLNVHAYSLSRGVTKERRTFRAP